jgi:ABC-type branched-subunit amino acid transport system permease subunit
MWSGDARVDATVLGETTRFLGPVVGALAGVAWNELALRFVLYHNLVPGVLLVMIVITRRRGFTTGAVLFFPRRGPCAPWA